MNRREFTRLVAVALAFPLVLPKKGLTVDKLCTIRDTFRARDDSWRGRGCLIEGWHVVFKRRNSCGYEVLDAHVSKRVAGIEHKDIIMFDPSHRPEIIEKVLRHHLRVFSEMIPYLVSPVGGG